VVLLGEISYFNKTPATARVQVAGGERAILLRMSHSDFGEVIAKYPNIRETLNRIGELRVISQKDGFCSFDFFMENIGWKRNRLIINRSLYPHLLRILRQALQPRLRKGMRLLEVGDGPAMLSEILLEEFPDLQNHLYLQATQLEESIVNPLNPFPSDFSRTKYLSERFDVICALEVFDRLPPEEIDKNLELAKRLLVPGGLLLIIRMKLVDIPVGLKRHDTTLIFQELEDLINERFPGALGGENLVKVTFQDADMDPVMEWNPGFCQGVHDGKVKLEAGDGRVEDLLLQVLLAQAGKGIFNPEEIQFNWLSWHVMTHGLELEDDGKEPEFGYFFQLYRLPGESGA